MRSLCFRLLCISLLPVSVVYLLGCESDPQSWGERGTWKGALFSPRAVETLKDGSWVILDRTNRVQIFTPRGEYIRGWTTPAGERGNPRGLDVDREGNILVADTHYGQVLRYSPEGEILQTIGHPGTGPGEFGLVTDIVEDASGVITTLEYGGRVRVQRFTGEGQFLLEWGEFGDGPRQFKRPQGIDLAPDGSLVVADSVNHRIQIFDGEGVLLQAWGVYGTEPGQMAYPYDVSVDSEGRIYVIEFGNHRVQVFNREGVSLQAIGSPGRRSGEFHEPWGITVLPGGEVLIADTKNDRIQNLGKLF